VVTARMKAPTIAGIRFDIYYIFVRLTAS